LNHREYGLVDVIQVLISRWPLLVISILVGGLMGLIFSFSRPPVYEASVFLQVSVDHGRALIPDDYTRLRAFDKVRLIFLADDTITQVLQKYSHETGGTNSIQDVAEFRASIKLTQRQEGFQLFVYSSSPVEASSLANLWGEIALSEIREATRHALRAAEYQSALYGAWCKIAAGEEGSESQIFWVCQYGGGQIAPGDLAEGVLEEVQKSRGILPVFSFSWIEKSSPPEKPVRSAFGWSVIAGALVGLILSGLFQIYRYLLLGTKHEVS
jgi:hypothetical protein